MFWYNEWHVHLTHNTRDNKVPQLELAYYTLDLFYTSCFSEISDELFFADYILSSCIPWASTCTPHCHASQGTHATGRYFVLWIYFDYNSWRYMLSLSKEWVSVMFVWDRLSKPSVQCQHCYDLHCIVYSKDSSQSLSLIGNVRRLGAWKVSDLRYSVPKPPEATLYHILISTTTSRIGQSRVF